MKKSNKLSLIEDEFLHLESQGLWKKTYMMIREESEVTYKHLKLDSARNDNNRNRNRYRDVLPYDNTRVILSDTNSSDYINANYVSLDDNKYNRRYILAQGPLPATIAHFWQMVWTENSKCIIMLTKIVEKNMVKCAQYYPSCEEENENHIYSDIGLSISFVDSTESGSYTKRILLLENKITNEERRIYQFHYTNWPDFGAPATPNSFLTFLWDIRLTGGCLDNPHNPSIIHCSAGIGRSGTFILIDLILLQVAEEQSMDMVDLKGTLLSLRKCRMGLIQSPEQLRFAYQAVIMGSKRVLNNSSELSSVVDDQVGMPSNENHYSKSSDDYSSSSRDSDFSENSDTDNSSSAINKAAEAVLYRRGRRYNKDQEDSILIPQSNLNNKTELVPEKFVNDQNGQATSTATDIKKQIFQHRSERTRRLVEEIRNNMHEQNLARERFLYRIGLGRFVSSNRAKFLFGVSAAVGVLSVACGYVVYKFINS